MTISVLTLFLVVLALGVSAFAWLAWILIEDWRRLNARLRATHEDPAPHYPQESGWGSQDEQEAQEWSPEDDVPEYSRDVFPVEPR